MKNRPSMSVIAIAVFALCGMAEVGAEDTMGTLTCTDLRCEYLVNPLGIDETQPRLSWVVESPRRGANQTAYQVLVATTEAQLAAGNADLWDSGKVESDQTAHVVYDGAPLASRTRCVWKVRAWDRDGNPSPWSEPALWTMGLLAPEDWSAKWIGADTRELNEDPELMLPPSPYLRKEFAADRPIRRATVHATALGIYELSINGQRVGDDYFAPGWTDYNKRVYYQTYDVTDLLQQGDNAIGGVLSNGWYAGYVGFGLLQNRGNAGRAFYGEVPALCAQLEIEYDDGSTSVVATDETWRAGLGPIRGSDLQMGETYDARQEAAGWDTASFEAAEWLPVTAMESPTAIREAYPGVPIRATEELQPVEITSPSEGVYIFNMGQNFAGCVRLKVEAPEGTRITLRFGEMLHGDGTLMTENLRKARAIDAYVCKGGGVETWQPSFTYHGFQYVEVTGYPGTPGLDAITGIVLGSETPLAGSFECSDDMVNQLYRNITWTQRANFVEVPTDCPQRDERLGWTGDAQIYVRSATYNRDVAAFFKKWLVDLEDAIRPYGAYPDFAPLPYLQCEPSPAWMDAGIICPYTIYTVYGDTRVIERHYDAMARFLDYLTETSEDNLRSPVHHMWGDWLSVGKTASNDYIASCYYAYDAKLMAEMAAAIGRADDAARYDALFTNVRDAIVAKYVTPEGTLTEDFQTAYALALYMDLLPEGVRPTAAARLVELIRDNDWHLATGFLGVKHALPVLSRFGYNDVAYRLLTNSTFPSWGYSVVNGATSIWERWNSYTKEDGIHDPGMNSFSHYAFGSVCEWMFASMVGIDTEGPGFKRIRIAPNPGGHGITSASASYDCINGRIASSWRIENGRFHLDVTVPANTMARVSVPALSASEVTESGKPATGAEGLVSVEQRDGTVTFEVGSGTYQFEAPEPGVAGKAHGDDINGDPECTVACYYFPNYHPDARNAKIHGEGWDEWELVKAAKPRFDGHHQPNVPLWGYEDESDPAAMAKKIDAAADHGIDAFI
ncbi:MAG: family 78 glycoside hydrolase catalytic domain, partial [bacterium]|nr:family 78 glycoside hydrolase catalytic domain [bacterium]